ncbi:MAG: hypothetical protein NTZ18_02450 [Candidatus Komeilibacteria bacterium]|nr:hypothetical protein [Candidatus Komeilibacteria bacterium]
MIRKEVPGGGNAQIAVAIAVKVVVDVQAGIVEVAYVDAVAGRIQKFARSRHKAPEDKRFTPR